MNEIFKQCKNSWRMETDYFLIKILQGSQKVLETQLHKALSAYLGYLFDDISL